MSIPRVVVLAFLVLFSARLAAADEPATFTLAPGDITSAQVRIDRNDGSTNLLVTFTSEKRAEYTQFTADNEGKRIKLVVNGKLVSEPTIREQIIGPTLEFSVPSREEADAMAKALLKQK